MTMCLWYSVAKHQHFNTSFGLFLPQNIKLTYNVPYKGIAGVRLPLYFSQLLTLITQDLQIYPGRVNSKTRKKVRTPRLIRVLIIKKSVQCLTIHQPKNLCIKVGERKEMYLPRYQILRQILNFLVIPTCVDKNKSILKYQILP